MGIRWKDFEIPKRLMVEESTLTARYGKFIAEPLEKGFGTTFGNCIRRMLLSSIEGAAVIALRIEDVDHEFSQIPEVLEDVPQVVLNIRGLVLRMHSRTPRVITLDVRKEGPVTGADLKTDGSVEIINPDHHLFTLNSDQKVYIELTVAQGRGFVTAEENKGEGLPLGVVPIDSVFSPVERVNFAVEDTRVVQVIDYDKLTLEIYTNGSVSPRDALNHAPAIWRKYLEIFDEVPEEIEKEEEIVIEEGSDLDHKLSKDIGELELSVRSVNCLSDAGIHTIYDLVVKSEAEMLKYRNFGKRSLTEITEILTPMGLSFGMNVEAPLEEALPTGAMVVEEE